MSFEDQARVAVRGAALGLRIEANRIGVLRSVDATRAARWLREVADELDKVAEPVPGKGET